MTQQASPDNRIRVAVFLADQNPHRDRSRGITEMTQWLLRNLKCRDDLDLVPIISRSSIQDQELRSSERCVPWRTDRAWGRFLSDAIHTWIMRAPVDVWYYPKGYVALFGKTQAPRVGTMHDTIIQHYADHYPSYRTKWDIEYWLHMTANSLRRLDQVLTVSEHARRQLGAFCARRAMQPPAIEVTYESSPWEQFVGHKFEKREYVLHLASSAPHKRTTWLLQNWEVLQGRGLELPPLVLVGDLDSRAKQLLARLKRVTVGPALKSAELVEKVGAARALLLPSEIEGFGLPALEASYVGTPVCYVNGTSVAEVMGPEGTWGGFELDNPDSFMSALGHALNASSVELTKIRDYQLRMFSSARTTHSIVKHLHRAAGRSVVETRPLEKTFI
jgi:glycosyltransferase involved in cell wall biosynthesis